MMKQNIFISTKQSILLSLSFIFTMACAESDGGISSENFLSSGEIQIKIRKDGASHVLGSFYNDEKAWPKILEKIATGDKEWLEIAVSFREVSDAGVSIELEKAVGEALSFSAANVLSISTKQFSLDEICSGPDIDDSRFDSYESSLREAEKRILALEGLEDDFESKSIKCIELLRESKKHIAKFYGVEAKSE